MADLIDRLSGEAGSQKLPVHQFMAGLRLYAHGLKTRADIASNWQLAAGAEQTQAAALADAVDLETGVANKIAYVLRAEAVAMILEDAADTFYHNPDGTVDKAAVQADMGL